MAETVTLREVLMEDLPVFFRYELDHESRRMAAFVSEDSTDRAAFDALWAGILADRGATARSVLFDGEVAGNVLCYEDSGRLEIGYWIGREYQGKGIATSALRAFLHEFESRPLHARVAKDNVASLRVLEKCGFGEVGEDRGYSNVRGEEVEEYIFRLD